MKTLEAGRTGKLLAICAAIFVAVIPAARTAALVPARSIWKYLDTGTNLGTAWRAPAFNDNAWPSGRAQLGYGDGDEATTIGYGPSSTNKYITAYFRHSFSVPTTSVFSGLVARVQRDDGAVAYLNGAELFRQNMPAGPIVYNTLAASAVGEADESAFYTVQLDTSLLVAGINVLAVEIHQSSATSSDLSFDLELSTVNPPIVLAVQGPVSGSTGMDASPRLDVSVSDPAGSNVTVTFYGRAAGGTPGPSFTIIAVPDTQHYVSSLYGGTPGIFTAQTDWIVANKAARNIVFVTQLGDCVQNGDNGGNDLEWHHATNALYRLENSGTTSLAHGIPYGIAVGNHDQSPAGNVNGTTAFYNQYFGVPHFDGRGYYGGHFGTNNNNHYELFSGSGLDFIAVHLEWDTSGQTNTLQWADNLLKTYASRRAIIISHYIINAGFQASFGPQGQAIYDALKGNPNLFLMLCGHVSPEEGQRTDVFNGHTVYTLMSDYQSRANGGDGWLRIMEFSPGNNLISVKTYSPTQQRFETDADSEFTLSYDMSNAGAFSTLGTNLNTGGNVSMLWSGLAPSITYEWFATATDGTRTTSTSVQQFRTAPPSTLEAPPLKITSIHAKSDGIHLAWASVPGRVYRVCAKENVSDSSWRDLSGDIPASSATTSWISSSPAPQSFYCVREIGGSAPR